MDDGGLEYWQELGQLEQQEYEMWLYWIDNQYNQFFELTGDFK